MLYLNTKLLNNLRETSCLPSDWKTKRICQRLCQNVHVNQHGEVRQRTSFFICVVNHCGESVVLNWFFFLKDLSPVFKCTTSCSYSNKLLVAQNSQPNAIISNNRRRFGEEQSKIPDFNFYNGLFGNLVLYNTLFPIFRRFPLSHLELKSKWTGFNKINYRSDLLRYICVLLRLI